MGRTDFRMADVTIRLRIPSYNVTAQSLAGRLVVRDSDYHKLKNAQNGYAAVVLSTVLANERLATYKYQSSVYFVTV